MSLVTRLPRPRAYADDGARDHRLDLLRGYAVVAMSVNHFGLDRSWFHHVSGRSVFLINAAEVFLFVSGVTLGLVCRRKPIMDAVVRCQRRAWQILLAILILALAGPLLEGEGVPAADIPRLIGAVLTLQEAPFWSDVLAAYVLFLLAAVPVLCLLASDRWRTATALVAGVYVGSQLDPEGLALPFASFRNVAANAPLFLGGLIFGWHRDTVVGWWRQFRGRVVVDVVVVLLALAGIVVYAGEGLGVPWMEAGLESMELGAREYQMPPQALLMVAVYLRVLWWIVDRGWWIVRPLLGWCVLPFGRSALVAYSAHALMMPVTWTIVEGIAEGGVPIDVERPLTATLITAGFLGLMAASVGVARVADRAARAIARPAARGPAWLAPGVVGVCVVGLLLSGADGTARDEDDWDAFEVRADWVYERLDDLDGPAAALAMLPLPPEIDDDELAASVARLIEEELGPESGPLTILVSAATDAEDPPIDAERLTRAWSESDRSASVLEATASEAESADAILLSVAWPEDEADRERALDRVRERVEAVRDRRDDVLAIVIIPIDS